MIILTELRQTCSACPSQWEGKTKGGLDFYVRYRFGILSWGFGDTPDEALMRAMSINISKRLGDPLDGVLDETSMLQEIGLEYRP